MKLLITYRMLTGTGRREVVSFEQAADVVGELRRAGASNITTVDSLGRLVSFDPGSTPADGSPSQVKLK